MSRTGKVIALSGWKGSGKDTVADYLVAEYGFEKVSFAARLKDIVASNYNIPRFWLDDPSLKEKPLTQYPVIPTDPFSSEMQRRLETELSSGYWTPRALCILEGTAKRAVHANYWVQRVAEAISQLPDEDFVISDMRYKSEADTLRMLLPNVQLIRVSRYDNLDTQDPSERDLDDYTFNWKLNNRGNINELYSRVDNLPILAFDDLADNNG